MYCEIEVDATGKTVGCWLADTIPDAGADHPLVRHVNGLPVGHEQIRINIDTLLAMEIEEACKLKAVIDEETGKPVMRQMDRAAYVAKNFRVNRTKSIPIPAHIKMPAGMKMRELVANS